MKRVASEDWRTWQHLGIRAVLFFFFNCYSSQEFCCLLAVVFYIQLCLLKILGWILTWLKRKIKEGGREAFLYLWAKGVYKNFYTRCSHGFDLGK